MISYQNKDNKMIFGIPIWIYNLNDEEVVERLKYYQKKDKTQLSHRISNISYVNKRLLYEVFKEFDTKSLSKIKETILRTQEVCNLVMNNSDTILLRSIYAEAKTCWVNGRKLLNTIDNDFNTKPSWCKKQVNYIVKEASNIISKHKEKINELEKTKCQQ